MSKCATEVYEPLTFQRLSAINMLRRERWHAGAKQEWLVVDWSNELAGETGELCNWIKKLRRIDTGVPQKSGITREELIAKIAKELGDVVICAELLADHLRLNLAACVQQAFNETSIKEGFPERL